LPDIANSMLADTLLPSGGPWGVLENVWISIRNNQRITFNSRASITHSKYFVLSQLVQQMQKHNRELFKFTPFYCRFVKLQPELINSPHLHFTPPPQKDRRFLRQKTDDVQQNSRLLCRFAWDLKQTTINIVLCSIRFSRFSYNFFRKFFISENVNNTIYIYNVDRKRANLPLGL
jgi:hypothetical protein